MRAVDPAIEPEPVAGRHAVGVAEAETVVEFLAEIGAAIAVGIGEAPDRGDGIDEERVALGAGSSGSGRRPMGMFRPSAKVVTLRARPVTGSKSERMRTVSVPCSTGSGGAEAARKAMPFSVQCLSKVGIGWPSASRRAGHG